MGESGPSFKGPPPSHGTSVAPEPAAPATLPTREQQEQQLEEGRQEIARDLAIISVNMQDLDGFEMVDPADFSSGARPWPGVDLYSMILRPRMDRLGPKATIYDRGTLAGVQKAAIQMLAEINRRRAARGEPPAETVFNQQQAASETTPLALSIETANMVQFSTDLVTAISDFPHVLPSSIDKTDPMWGRVNALRRGDITYGQASESTMVFDQNRQRIATGRHLYQGGRYVGRWEQEVEYNTSITNEGYPPKTLGHYRESLLGEDRKTIEEVRVRFNRSGRVYTVEKGHYADGVQTGITQLQFDYDNDGHVIQTTEIELDASGQNELRRVTRPVATETPVAAPAEVVAPIETPLPPTPAPEVLSHANGASVEQKGGLQGLMNLFRRKKQVNLAR